MKVEIYFNLHKRLFSIRERHGKVIAHKRWVGLVRPTFVVQQGGRERVLRDKSKNVHAFVKGYLQDADNVSRNPQVITREVEVTYNPYKYETFVDKKDESFVYYADEVLLSHNKVTAYIS